MTAGLVVTIIVAYYLFGYRPELDPFRKEDDVSDSQQPIPFRPNPVDEIVLGAVRTLFRQGGTGICVRNQKQSRFERSLVKVSPSSCASSRVSSDYQQCVLSMSDLQIITGISILISGFAQLRCGLQSYHWQVLVYLAWFSSLTHLSCLTFLRNYLYNHPGELIWRLSSMFILVVMLLVAMIPTGNFGWSGHDEGKFTPSTYALCSFGQSMDTSSVSFTSMMISTILLVFGFASRAVRLSKSLSVSVIGKARRALNIKLLTILRKLYDWCEVQSHPRGLKRTLVYRPLLAAFLTVRASLDIFSSMLMEVCGTVLTTTQVLNHC